MRPRYPENLRQAGIEGRVEIEFVVDERGRVDMNTVKVLESTHALFTAAVRNALAGMRFTPARVGGNPVRQFVRLPVVFKIER
jgi:protein TonB